MVGVEGSLVHFFGGFGIKIGRAIVVRSSFIAHPWILVFHVVKSTARSDVHDGQGDAIENADGEFFSFDEGFNEDFVSILGCVFHRS